MNEVEFEQLKRAAALGALLPEERRRLEALAAEDEGRARQVAEGDAVLHAFAAERELRAEVLAVTEPGEEADEALRRLTSSAAVAGEALRVRLRHGREAGGQVVVPPVPSWRRTLGFVCLAAAAALVLWIGLGPGDGFPAEAPDDLRAGARLQLVLVTPTLTAAQRTISWAAVAGASGYDVEILDRDGKVVLHRGDELQKSATWELSRDQYQTLRSHRPLRLRVTALDGVGLSIGSSGDLELVLR